MTSTGRDVEAAIVAAGNNADHVDAVARAAGVTTSRDDRRWWAHSRTPLYHPDAITLVPGLGADTVLDGIELSEGCSVKDSFADLDLSAAGFCVLVEGSWLWHEAVAPDPEAIVASCTLTRSATVVGATDVAVPAGADPWQAVLAAVAREAPGMPAVAWEPTPTVPDAVAAGFRVVGPMRVWILGDLG